MTQMKPKNQQKTTKLFLKLTISQLNHVQSLQNFQKIEKVTCVLKDFHEVTQALGGRSACILEVHIL